MLGACTLSHADSTSARVFDSSASKPQSSPPCPALPLSPAINIRFLECVEAFDAAAFAIAPSEALLVDPQQRMMLEVRTPVGMAQGRGQEGDQSGCRRLAPPRACPYPALPCPAAGRVGRAVAVLCPRQAGRRRRRRGGGPVLLGLCHADRSRTAGGESWGRGASTRAAARCGGPEASWGLPALPPSVVSAEHATVLPASMCRWARRTRPPAAASAWPPAASPSATASRVGGGAGGLERWRARPCGQGTPHGCSTCLGMEWLLLPAARHAGTRRRVPPPPPPPPLVVSLQGPPSRWTPPAAAA